MSQTESSWANQLRRLLDCANLLLQQGNHPAASDNMVQAAELLFLQAKKETDTEEKKCHHCIVIRKEVSAHLLEFSFTEQDINNIQGTGNNEPHCDIKRENQAAAENAAGRAKRNFVRNAVCPGEKGISFCKGVKNQAD